MLSPYPVLSPALDRTSVRVGPAGIFITRVRASTPAAAHGGVRPGMRILSANGRSLDGALKGALTDLVRTERRLELELVYDLEGYSQIDKGEEFRRVAMAALAEDSASLADLTAAAGSHVVHYLGTAAVQESSADALYAAFGKIKKKHIKTRKQALDWSLTPTHLQLRLHAKHSASSEEVRCGLRPVSGARVRGLCLRVPGQPPSPHPPTPDCFDGQSTTLLQHALVDIEHCAALAEAVALVSNELINGSRHLVCSIYVAKSSKEVNSHSPQPLPPSTFCRLLWRAAIVARRAGWFHGNARRWCWPLAFSCASGKSAVSSVPCPSTCGNGPPP